MKFTILKGDNLKSALPKIAELRIKVFAEYPYLYAGTAEYEAAYLGEFAKSEGAIVVAAMDGDDIVGVATGAPMEDHAAEFAAGLESAKLPADQVFYCAESVLLPQYRGQGAGHVFFDQREAHGRAMGRKYSVFCSVVRKNHPMKPANYKALDPFWRKRGYTPIEGAISYFSWQDPNAAEPSEKPMQIWSKPL